MTDQALTVKKADAPAQWGDRGELGALANRWRTMLPNAKEFTDNEVLAIAQYSLVADINPFRGEAYFYKDRGRLQMVDGYKILVRWANDKDPYQDRDEDLPLADSQVEHVRVWILRDSDRGKIKEWTELGASWREAFEIVATYADGVVTTDDVQTKDGRPKDPPKGWTWRQVARKRALKTALNLSHGAPSPQEMAEYRYKVNGIQTIPEDWEGTEISGYEAERLAVLKAQDRANRTEWDAMSREDHQRQLQRNTNLIRGEDVDQFPDEPPDNGPQYDDSPPEWFDSGETVDAPTDEQMAEAEQVLDEKALADAQHKLFVSVNNATDGHFNAAKHLVNAIQLEKGEDFTWPPTDDKNAWNDLYRVGVAYAKKERGEK